MTDIRVVLRTIEQIRAACKELDDLRQRQAETYRGESDALKKLAGEMTAQMQERYADFKKNNLGRIRSGLERLVQLLCLDYKAEYDAAPDNKSTYLEQDEQTNLDALYRLLDAINAGVSKLNEVKMADLVPPETVVVEGEEIVVTKGGDTRRFGPDTPKRNRTEPLQPLKAPAKRMLGYCKDALACLEVLEQSYDRQFNAAAFSAYVERCNKERLGRLMIKQTDDYDQRFSQLMVDSSAQAVPESFFVGLEQDGKTYDVDETTIPSQYSEAMTLGEMELPVDTEEKHLGYFRSSPVLKKYMRDGHLRAPLVLDLKSCGNILLNINEEVYSEDTVAFVNQIIMQFLLSFPANRINFCLVDADNQMGFSPFKSLTKINNGILMNGIIRDDRQLENTIKDMEQIMYKIDDDILSYNNVPDIFEYNRRYEANPQSVHLFVFVNYPSNIRNDDLAKRIGKILQNGNKTGIFCLIINNANVPLESGFKEGEHNQFLEIANKHCLVINKKGRSMSLVQPENAKFVPRTTLPITKLQGIVDNLKDEGEKKRQIVIPMDRMFRDTDEAAASARGIPSSAEVLDIPIGARGGEIQNLLLKTTGDGSSHAVIIGGTGSGKSNLLHTIILSACYKYSPEELNLYIVDFKGGVEFEYYEAGKVRANQIPHIKLTGLTSDLEDGVSILSNLHKELRRREDMFRDNQVEDICQYRALGKKIPRLFVIIDEIQELFEQDDRLGQKAIDILRELFKKGRAFGINILWASQNVPKTPGLKDKVLSQIGNRISLRLNEPDDALDIKIDPKVVRNLNRPEKGLGVINDIRYGNDSVEFRVAYAESSANRVRFSQMIIDKWRSVTEQMPSEPLYIVGDDAEPSPVGENTVYSKVPQESDVVSKAFEKYILQLGQDYVTGKPFNVELNMLENKMNMLMVGHDAEILRDMMGYSLLSTLIAQMTNADCRGKGTRIHCANGDNITPKNEKDLFNVLREDFAPLMQNASTVNALRDSIRDVYRVYKQRAIAAESTEKAEAYAPEIVVIHSLQRYVDLFTENPTLSLREEGAAQAAQPAPAADTSAASSLAAAMAMFDMAKPSAAPAPKSGADGGMPASISFCNAFKELLERGGKYNIHFIISVDNPLALSAVKTELGNCTYKAFVKGVSTSVLTQLLGDYKVTNGLTNPKVAMICQRDERSKVRVYRFEPEVDSGWYGKLRDTYRPLMEAMQ